MVNSQNPDIYALSWYLDIESPYWKGIVFGDYEMVFPLPIQSKYMIFKILNTNYLTKDVNIYARCEFDQKLVGEAISNEIAKYRFVNFSINPSIPLSNTFNVSIKKKQYIDFEDHEGYPQKTLRKSLRDAEANEYVVRHGIDIYTAVSFLRKELSLKDINLKKPFFLKLEALISKSIEKKYGYVSGLYKNETLCAVDFYTLIGNKLFLIQNAGNELSKVGGMSYLLYNIIERFRPNIKYVDFMGSNSPKIITFNKNFCNKEVEYSWITKP